MFRPTLRSMTQFNIEVVSDSVCPWCYVGKRKLDAAITAYKQLHPDSGDTFSTTWMPFYLNPGAPKTGNNFHLTFFFFLEKSLTRRQVLTRPLITKPSSARIARP